MSPAAIVLHKIPEGLALGSITGMFWWSAAVELATLAGAYFGWLVLEFENLITPIVAHGLYDFLALVYLARQIKTRNLAIQVPATTLDSETAHERTHDKDDHLPGTI